MPIIDYKNEFLALRKQRELIENGQHDYQKCFATDLFINSDIPVFNTLFSNTSKKADSTLDKTGQKNQILNSLKQSVDNKTLMPKEEKTLENIIYKDKTPPFVFNLIQNVSVDHFDTVKNFFNSKPSIDDIRVVVVAPFPLEDAEQMVTVEALELMNKMIKAMKLNNSQYFYQFLDEQTNKDIFYSTIVKLNPELILTFGATATNYFLGKKERLSDIHGHSFQKILKTTSNVYRFQFVPIFHPDYLLINPQLKKTAWLDLQKCMKILRIPI
ncbi:MAG: hypothetical protein H6622_06545 [Halobacteriovoraceae bacterium]|nr:hypothetical protein [Halobacteriovoraceae bacterium]